MTVRCSPITESAVVVEFGDCIDPATLATVWALAWQLDRVPLRGMIEYVTAYTTVTLFFDPAQVDVGTIPAEIERRIGELRVPSTSERKPIEIPVCYAGEFAPDLEFVAAHHGLTVDQVIELHSGSEYLVYLIGFMPGFPYLGGMSPRIAVPRLATPRAVVPAGSVGIAGEQTGVYPLATPGGWRLIGRTPRVLFDPQQRPPCLLSPGDRVRFRPISREEYEHMLIH